MSIASLKICYCCSIYNLLKQELIPRLLTLFTCLLAKMPSPHMQDRLLIDIFASPISCLGFHVLGKVNPPSLVFYILYLHLHMIQEQGYIRYGNYRLLLLSGLWGNCLYAAQVLLNSLLIILSLSILC